MMRLLIAILITAASILPATAQDGAAWYAVMEAAAGGGAIDLSVVSSNHSATAAHASTWTTSGANLGAANASRRIVVCISWRSAVAAASTDLMTIGGITATKIAASTNATTFIGFFTEIYIATVPTGTSGNVAISFSADALWANWCAYRLTGAATTASDIASHDNTGGTTITVGAGGVVIASGSSNTTGPAASMTGLTENYDVLTDASDDVAASGSHESPTGEASRTVRINMSGVYDTASFVAIDAL